MRREFRTLSFAWCLRCFGLRRREEGRWLRREVTSCSLNATRSDCMVRQYLSQTWLRVAFIVCTDRIESQLTFLCLNQIWNVNEWIVLNVRAILCVRSVTRYTLASDFISLDGLFPCDQAGFFSPSLTHQNSACALHICDYKFMHCITMCM